MNKLQLKLMIIFRFFIALVFSSFLFLLPLKNNWYVLPLIFLNVIVQFVCAYIHMLPYIKELKKYYINK